jgi:hypothetical protein
MYETDTVVQLNENPTMLSLALACFIYDAKVAVDHLSGFNVGGRYLVVLYYQPGKFERRTQLEEKEKDLQELRKRVQHHKSTLGTTK